MQYDAAEGVLYYDHGINLPNVCSKAPEYIYKPNINKTEDKLVGSRVAGEAGSVPRKLPDSDSKTGSRSGLIKIACNLSLSI